MATGYEEIYARVAHHGREESSEKAIENALLEATVLSELPAHAAG
jgi:hypothetical protein